ncbi:MAG TPA: SDR family NAD(P)-dependent oxidoreductase, partial [Geodermatophilus sp.]|nr:SDR family NAD(P)-dependent oxidoreductase [Geodermatophilus sp.]
MDLSGKVAIVTGSGRGLGLAYATELARSGAAVVVNDVDAAVAEAAVKSIADAGGTAVAEVAPVGTSEAAQALVDRAVGEFGRLDVLVNNAGILRD